MRIPVLALTSEVWRRYRWGLAACAMLWLVLTVSGQVLPHDVWSVRSPGVVPLAIISFVGVVAFVACAFSLTGGHTLETRETVFPTRLFLLPVRTSTLVFWPMIQAAGLMCAVWLGWDRTIFRPAGIEMYSGWPILLAAAGMVWFQAAAWWPYPVPYIRVGAMLLAPGLVILIPVYGMQLGISEIVWMGLLAILVPAAFVVAFVGVSRARRGDTPHWRWPARMVQALIAWLPGRRASFASPLAAQAWFEWRVRGIAYLFMIGMVTGSLGIGFLLGGEQAIRQLASSNVSPRLTAVIQTLTPAGYILGLFLAIPLLFAALWGNELGGTRGIGAVAGMSPAGCHPFLALRPLNDMEFVGSKARSAARSAVVAWAITGIVILLWIGLRGKWTELAGAPLLENHRTAVTVVAAITGLACIVVLTWLYLLAGLWVGLTGIAWLSHTIPVVGAVGWIPLVIAAGELTHHSDWLAIAVAALPFLATAAVMLKAALAVISIRAVQRRALISRGRIAVGIAAWVAFVVALFAVVNWWLPSHLVAAWALALAVLLIVPFNRIVVAPLALAYGRHR